MSRHASLAARGAVSAGVLGLLLALLPWREVLAAVAGELRGARWWLVLAAVAALHVGAAMKWRLLLAAAGVRAGLLEALSAHGAGLSANLLLPTVSGGDVVRAGLVYRRRGRGEALAVVGLADRILDVGALLAWAAVGALAAPRAAGRAPLHLAAALVAGLLAALLGAALLGRRLPAERLPERLRPVWSRLRAAGRALARRPGPAAVAGLAALAIQGCLVAANAWIGAGVGIEAPLAAWAFAWPLAKVVAMLPVSLGGLGVSEAAMAAFLSPFGVPVALAVTQSIVWQSLRLAVGLVGGSAAVWLPAPAGDVRGGEAA